MQFKVHYKETLYFCIMLVINLFIYMIVFWKVFIDYYAFEFLGIIFLGLWYGLIGLTANFVIKMIFIGRIKGNAIKINEEQFPEIFKILKSHSEKLGLNNIPNMYVINGDGVLNAFAARFLRRHYVILFSEILEAAYQEGIDAVSFVIGHELGHIKRKHTSLLNFLLLFPANFIPFLNFAYSRGCEYTCDNIGYNLCPSGSIKGLLVLSVGKKLYHKVNLRRLILSDDYEFGFDMKFAEYFSSHPMVINRIREIYELNKCDDLNEFDSFISPKIDFDSIEKNL